VAPKARERKSLGRSGVILLPRDLPNLGQGAIAHHRGGNPRKRENPRGVKARGGIPREGLALPLLLAEIVPATIDQLRPLNDSDPVIPLLFAP